MMIIITDWIVAVVAVLLADFIVDVARGPLSRYGVNVFWKDQISIRLSTLSLHAASAAGATRGQAKDGQGPSDLQTQHEHEFSSYIGESPDDPTLRDLSEHSFSISPDFNIDDSDSDSDGELDPYVHPQNRDENQNGVDNMSGSGRGRSSFRHSTDRHASDLPLLEKEEDRGPTQRLDSRSASVASAVSTSATLPPLLPRDTSLTRSASPSAMMQGQSAARKKYVLAGIFLVVCLLSFVLQTELGRYVQHELGWNKAYCMLYLTHGSWSLLWPAQLLVLRLQRRNRNLPWSVFWRRHVEVLRSTAHMVSEQSLNVPKHVMQRSPVPYMLRTTAFVTTCLTVAGLTWYVAVNMTSPSDLTAIYNCSAFFAYAFSVPLLKEKLRLDKSLAVLVAIVGVLVVAYGDSASTDAPRDAVAIAQAGTRLLGNLIIGVGSVLYGLYEVLYKRYACPPEGVSASRGVIFANTFGSCVGLFTLLILWIPLPILHILGWETFSLPSGEAALYLWISVLMNATFAGSFLVLISLTSPVLSSVAALLTIFIVALADWLLTGEALSFAAVTGGAMIVVAFLVLSWSTWREMSEEEQHSGQGGVYREAPVEWDSDNEESGG